MDPVSIDTCIAAAFDPELRDRRCELCGHTRAMVTPCITALPRILLVHLKRFRGVKRVGYDGSIQFQHLKIAKEVVLSPTLDLTRVTSPDVRAPPECGLTESHVRHIARQNRNPAVTSSHLRDSSRTAQEEEEEEKEAAAARARRAQASRAACAAYQHSPTTSGWSRTTSERVGSSQAGAVRILPPVSSPNDTTPLSSSKGSTFTPGKYSSKRAIGMTAAATDTQRKASAMYDDLMRTEGRATAAFRKHQRQEEGSKNRSTSMWGARAVPPTSTLAVRGTSQRLSGAGGLPSLGPSGAGAAGASVGRSMQDEGVPTGSPPTRRPSSATARHSGGNTGHGGAGSLRGGAPPALCLFRLRGGGRTGR